MTSPRYRPGRPAIEVLFLDDVEQDEEGTVHDYDVLDADGKPRVLDDKCPTCVFRPGNLMHLRPGRLRDMVDSALTAGTWITCHQTLPYHPDNAGWQAICRGFYDHHGRFSHRLQQLKQDRGITFVPLPAKPCPVPPTPPGERDDAPASAGHTTATDCPPGTAPASS